MTYVAAIHLYTVASGSEMEVITGETLDEVNMKFRDIQKEINMDTDIESIERVVLTKVDDKGRLEFSKKVQTIHFYSVTTVVDDS